MKTALISVLLFSVISVPKNKMPSVSGRIFSSSSLRDASPGLIYQTEMLCPYDEALSAAPLSRNEENVVFSAMLTR